MNNTDYRASFEILEKRYDSLAGQVPKLHALLDTSYAAQERLAKQVQSMEQDVIKQREIVRTVLLQSAEEKHELEAEIIMLKKVLKNFEVSNGDLNRLGD